MIDNDDFIIKEPVVIGSYKVSYALYEDKNKHTWNSLKNPYNTVSESDLYKKQSEKFEGLVIIRSNDACFSSLNTSLDVHTKTNRILYAFKPNKVLTDENCEDWLKLVKKHNLLPRYSKVKEIVKNKNVVFDTRGITRNMLYVYLTVVRMLVEEPKMVKNILKLVDKYKTNFFVAFVASIYLGVTNTGHLFCCPADYYPARKNITDLKNLPFNLMIGLYKFIKEKCPPAPMKIDNVFSATTSVAALGGIKGKLDINKHISTNFDDIFNTKPEEIGKLLEKEGIVC